MKTILITGGAGFFGTILKKEFLKKDYVCISIDLEPDSFTDPNFIAIQGDIRNRELLDSLFQKYNFDAIFHCAAMLAHDRSKKNELWTSNVDGTQNIADYAKKYQVPKIIFISSNCLWAQNFDTPVKETEFPNPIEIYGKSKWEGEKILMSQKHIVPCIIFRSPTIMDEGRLGLLSILFEFIDENRKLPMVGDGKNIYQFIYAKDFVHAFELALDYPKSEIFNIGSDHVKTFNEVYEYVIQKSGSKSKLRHYPKSIMTLGMKIAYLLRFISFRSLPIQNDFGKFCF